MHRFLALLIFTSLLLCMPVAHATGSCERVVVSADSAYPPLHWYDGQVLRGASILIVTRILDNLGLPYELRYLGPWKRVLSAAQQGNIDMIVTLKNTPERRRFLSFSDVVFNNPIVVFAKKDKTFSYAKWEDLAGLKGGMARGNRFGQPFDDFMDSRLRVMEADNLETAFKMLQADRFDYVMTGYYSGLAYLASMNLGEQLIPLQPFLIDSQNLFGFVAQSPCVVYLPAFNMELEKLHKDGYIERALIQARAEWQKSFVRGRN